VLYELADQGQYQDTRRDTIDYLSRQFQIDRRQATRVQRTARALLPHVHGQLVNELEFATQALDSAAALHELGLPVSHSGYHKHGAYLLQNYDMPGFSRREQDLLSFLVLNHRRKPRLPEDAPNFRPDWALVQVLRLACLFNRTRMDQRLPPLKLEAVKKGWVLELPAEWLAEHPLVEEDLRLESELLGILGHSLTLRTTG
jgi:exopolyphosphatase/guanosine-5'-triphosphate,3'-diphosphate pyrophosphatase